LAEAIKHEKPITKRSNHGREMANSARRRSASCAAGALTRQAARASALCAAEARQRLRHLARPPYSCKRKYACTTGGNRAEREIINTEGETRQSENAKRSLLLLTARYSSLLGAAEGYRIITACQYWRSTAPPSCALCKHQPGLAKRRNGVKRKWRKNSIWKAWKCWSFVKYSRRNRNEETSWRNMKSIQ